MAFNPLQADSILALISGHVQEFVEDHPDQVECSTTMSLAEEFQEMFADVARRLIGLYKGAKKANQGALIRSLQHLRETQIIAQDGILIAHFDISETSYFEEVKALEPFEVGRKTKKAKPNPPEVTVGAPAAEVLAEATPIASPSQNPSSQVPSSQVPLNRVPVTEDLRF